MNHITRTKRHTRIMWTVWIVWILVLVGILSNLPEPECFTDSCVQCLDDCTEPLSTNEGE